MTLTPTASWELATWAILDTFPGEIFGAGPTGTLTRCYFTYLTDTLLGSVDTYLYPSAGVGLSPTFGYGSAAWNLVGAVIKGSGAAVTLNVTNPGTVLAEKLTLDLFGPIASPTITNTTNGTSVTINTSVAGTKHLIVNTGAFTALNDGANVIGSVTHSGAVPFLTLNPGINVLQVSGAACTGSTLVTVSFAPGYE
jgi:hypothetical protein